MIRVVKQKYVYEFSNVAGLIPISGDVIIKRAMEAGEDVVSWMEEHTEPYEKDYYLVTGITRDRLVQVSCCPKLVKGGQYETVRILAVDPEDAKATALKDADLGEVLVVRREFGYPGLTTIDSPTKPAK